MTTSTATDEQWDATTSTLPDPNELRLAANGRFAAGALDEALPLYSLALEVSKNRNDPDVDVVVHLCNRSACLYKMEMYEEACTDATEAVTLSEETNSKAFFRLARAQIALKDYTSALNTIDKAMELCNGQLKTQQQTDNNGNENDGTNNPLILQIKEFDKLKTMALRKQKQSLAHPDQTTTSTQDAKSIKLEPRTPSIKEFTRTTKHSESYNPLGEGNFSTVVVCTHKVTHEKFALKIIEKEECKKLAKRQHPNVYNEVAMERRILTQKRLPWNVNVVQAYHAMQGKDVYYFDSLPHTSSRLCTFKFLTTSLFCINKTMATYTS